MIPQIPEIYNVVFIGISLLAIYFFSKACRHNRMVLIVILAYALIQGLIAISGFYSSKFEFPPRILLAILPAFLGVLYFVFSKKSKKIISSMDPKWLTYVHLVRFPVEIFLFLLFFNKLIPIEMTFEGWNFDILIGVTAPIISYFVFTKKILAEKTLFFWNIIGLVFLINIVLIAILSTPYPFQQFGLSQPNIAVFYFPYIWLPSIIVPIVFMSHLIILKRIWIRKAN